MSDRRGPNIAPARFDAASAASVAGLPGGGLLVNLGTPAFQYRTMILEVRGESHDRG